MNLRPLLAIFLAALSLVAGGTEGRLPFQNYGPDQGLPSLTAHCLAQDAEGFLWFGTENGLVRFDGHHYRRWTLEDGLPSAYVPRILPASGGGLWVGTLQGLVRIRQGRIERAIFGETPSQSGAIFLSLDRAGRLWVATHAGIFIQKEDLRFEAHAWKPEGRFFGLVFGERSRSFFLARDKGIQEFLPDGSTRAWGIEQGLPEGSSIQVAEDGRGRLWAGGGRFLYVKEPGSDRFEDRSALLPVSLYPGGTPTVDSDGSLWLPTQNGALHLEGEHAELLDGNAGLPFRWVRTVFRDREGSLWALGSSVARLQGQGRVRNSTTADGLPGETVWCIFRDPQGRLWVGTDDGLVWASPEGWQRLPGTEGRRIKALAMDREGTLWMANPMGPLLWLKRGERTAVEAPLAEAGHSVNSLLVDRQGGIWFGHASRGVLRWDPAAARLVSEWGPEQAQVKGLGAYALSEDAQGRLWAGSSAGLLLREKEGLWRAFTAQEGLASSAVTGAAPLADGSAWVHYLDPLGITRVKVEGGKLKVLETRRQGKGLLSDLVYAAGTDAQGRLWVTTDQGLERLDPPFRLGRLDGLVSDDCSKFALLVERDLLWVGTSRGLVRFRSDGLESPPPPRAHLLQALFGTRDLEPPFGGKLVVPHRESTVAFRIAAPSYLNERAVRFQVRLLGLEEVWREVESTLVRYVALPVGAYRFEVRAAGGDGVFGAVSALEFRVRPPWWGSWWFYTLEGLGALGLVFLVVRIRLRHLARSKTRLETLVAQRTQEMHGMNAALQHANEALEEANRALEAQSLTDPLTGLHNRRYLTLVIEDDAVQVQRVYRDAGATAPLPNQDMVFLVVDLDDFKVVNDRHGHAMGDAVLRQTALILRRAARESDAVIRWGGEEFLVVARATSREEAAALAERIRLLMAEQSLVQPGGEAVRWTCSVGFAPFPFQAPDPGWLGWERVLEVADACLYAAKQSGRNAWVGVMPRPSLKREKHGARIPDDLPLLVQEGVLEVLSSRPDPFRPRMGSVMG